MEELNGILHGLPLLATILLVAMLAVLVAMGSDLCFGWRKAKMRGEARTSYAFSRSFSKFLLYMGMMIVSGCIDMLIHFVMYMFKVYYYVPVVAIGIAIVLCVTEIWSMKEKADEKTRNSIKNAIDLVQKTLTHDQIVAVLAEAMRQANKNAGKD